MSITVQIDSGVAVVTLNRPEKLNALTAEMLLALTEAFIGFRDGAELRAVILRGAGSKAFCVGTDLAALVELNKPAARAASERGQAACDAIEHCPVPVIAAINGWAAGGGFELALACHLRVVGEGVRIALPKAKHGLLPGYGGTQRLPRIIGNGRALEVILAGGEIAGDQALHVGLVNRIVPEGEALNASLDLARAIARLAPLAVRSCLKVVVEGLPMSLEEGLKLETELFAELFATQDAREGATAFLEKRKPNFTGR